MAASGRPRPGPLPAGAERCVPGAPAAATAAAARAASRLLLLAASSPGELAIVSGQRQLRRAAPPPGPAPRPAREGPAKRRWPQPPITAARDKIGQCTAPGRPNGASGGGERECSGTGESWYPAGSSAYLPDSPPWAGGGMRARPSAPPPPQLQSWALGRRGMSRVAHKYFNPCNL